MSQSTLPKVWLRGPVTNVPPLLQPVAHALLQAKEEINELMQNFPEDKHWEKPAGATSPGFHLQHIAGVLDRLFTYAEGGHLPMSNCNIYLQKENLGAKFLLTS